MSNLPLPSEAPCIVVGAGPAGLACALSLIREGIRSVVLDKLAQDQLASRASVVHSLTLEELDKFSCADELISVGTKSHNITFVDQQERHISDIRFAQLEGATKFPFALVVQQHLVERILRTRLEVEGIHVHRQISVSEIRESDGACEVVTEDGQIIKTKYMVAADGARSTIRTQTGITFVDPTTGKPAGEHIQSSSTRLFVLGDIEFETPCPPNLPRDRTMIIATLHGPFAFMPLRNPTNQSRPLFRVGMGIAPTDPPPERSPSAEYLQRLIDSRGPGSHRKDGILPPRIKTVNESSCHRVYSAIAERFFVRAHGAYVVLVGDAGHRHSPAGGQGMNLGICDGIRAGKAIAQHVAAGGASDDVLQQYATRRRQIATEVIEVAETLDKLEFARKWWIALVRDYAMWVLLSIPSINKALARRMSCIPYRE